MTLRHASADRIPFSYDLHLDFISAWNALDQKNTGGKAGGVLSLLRRQIELTKPLNPLVVTDDPTNVAIELTKIQTQFTSMVPNPDHRVQLQGTAIIMTRYQHDPRYATTCKLIQKDKAKQLDYSKVAQVLPQRATIRMECNRIIKLNERCIEHQFQQDR